MKTGTEKDIGNTTEALFLMNQMLKTLNGDNSASPKWVDDPNQTKAYRIFFYNGKNKRRPPFSVMQNPLRAQLRIAFAFNSILDSHPMMQ